MVDCGPNDALAVDICLISYLAKDGRYLSPMTDTSIRTMDRWIAYLKRKYIAHSKGKYKTMLPSIVPGETS